uniref:Uncharacterized protein n=1 Tax=Trichogramma kaykai TaxID=54128 RepID=A0ABD2XE33_9HYME
MGRLFLIIDSGYTHTILFHRSNSNYTSSLFPDLRCKDNVRTATALAPAASTARVKRLIDFLLQASTATVTMHCNKIFRVRDKCYVFDVVVN